MAPLSPDSLFHQQDSERMLNNYGRLPLDFVRGKGSWLYNSDGASFLDFTSGIAVNALGHSPDEVVSAIYKQAQSFIHISNVFPIKPQLDLAELLLNHTKFEKAFFCNSGTEANEAAIKFARKYFSKLGDNRTEIISFKNSFHGRTYGGLAATGQDKLKEGFGPMLEGFHIINFNDCDELRAAASKKTAAIILEPLQAEGGINLASKDFIKALHEVREKTNCLIIADEIQTGLGRLGYFLGSELIGLQPDLLTLAKPLGGGLPLGCVLLKNQQASYISPGDHGSTFGGNPVSCAAGIAVINKITEDGFLNSVQKKSDMLKTGLQALAQKFSEPLPIRGAGLLLGVQTRIPVAEFMKAARSLNLLVLRAGVDVIRLLPPLTVTEEEIKQALDILDQVWSSFAKEGEQ
jgi:predicted acetylornithine/succinylornithine family transaminase